MGRSVRSRDGRARFFPWMQFIGLLSLMLLTACHSKRGPQQTQNPPEKIWEEFSGEKALAHVQAMVDFGPRPPGTDTIEKTRGYLTKQLALAGWKVTRQVFTDVTPRGKVQFV